MNRKQKRSKYGEYDDSFYLTRYEDTKYSAEKILGIIIDLINITSVVDVGCGVGAWLSIFKSLNNNGIVRGYDGNYVNKSYLTISNEEFTEFNLEEHIYPKERYDLAISLEVAEHLPKTRAISFVKDLTAFSDIVLFSAAFPGQGGVTHINEQPISYWEEIFNSFNYKLYDVIRPKIYDDKNIPMWYRQNSVLFVNKENPICSKIGELDQFPVQDIIYIEVFEKYIKYYNKVLNRSLLERAHDTIKKLMDTIKSV